ncbi:hypothetical protein [Nocardia brasiliensis]|uniref:hypothetical protein n=1 Tax=Nocardia brasiliensis TaxID=37326 RepID=UPI00366D0A1D
MQRFEVEIETLRRSAKAADAAGAEAKAINLGPAVDPVASAMPGADSVASAAATLADAWERRLKQWATDIDKLGDKVSAAADLYSKNEQEAARVFAATMFERWLHGENGSVFRP